MKELIKIAENLNELLEMEVMDNEKLEEICNILKSSKMYHFVIADFEFFNQEKLALIVEEKFKSCSIQDFERTSILRDLEKKCEKHVLFNRFFKLENSLFYPDFYTLVYFFTGKSKNDRAIYSRVTSPQNGLFRKPKSII